MTVDSPDTVRYDVAEHVATIELNWPERQDFYLSSRVFPTRDAQEGPKSFKEKRDARFEAR